MKSRQSGFLSFALLTLYFMGRTLQLFAGTVPNLVIVAFHVLPVAVFALLHGGRIYRWRGILAFTALCLGVATLFESVSLRTGFPFGHYRFTDVMGPKVCGLPILLAVAYVGMGYLSWIVSLSILGGENEALTGRRTILAPLLASVVMTAWDLSMEAVWADVDHAWVWRDGGPYFGVPVSNFFGWMLTTYAFYQLFALYRRRREAVPTARSHWLFAILFYGLSAIGNLFVVSPSWMGGAFVDATGKRWLISNVVWASRLVSIFVMLPFSLIAWFRTANHPIRANLSTVCGEL